MCVAWWPSTGQAAGLCRSSRLPGTCTKWVKGHAASRWAGSSPATEAECPPRKLRWPQVCCPGCEDAGKCPPSVICTVHFQSHFSCGSGRHQ